METVATPMGLEKRRRGMLDSRNVAATADFDKGYLDQQEAAHSQPLTLMQGYANRGDDAGLRGGAQKALTKIQDHLNHITQLKARGAVAY